MFFIESIIPKNILDDFKKAKTKDEIKKKFLKMNLALPYIIHSELESDPPFTISFSVFSLSKGTLSRPSGLFITNISLSSKIISIPKGIFLNIGDIEIEFLKEGLAKEVGIEIAAGLKKGGYKAKLVEDRGLGIEVKGEKAIELKYHGDPFSELELSKGYRYGFKEIRENTRIEEFKVQSLSEQLVRKAGASATWWSDQAKAIGEAGRLVIEPPLHRPKDVVDTYAITKSLAESYRIKKPIRALITKKHKKADVLIEEFKTLDWRNPEVKQKFVDLEKNRQAYLNKIKVDVTNIIKKSEPP
ncbi:hypothetical protein LCGC14_3131520, partial [marine sediment metagenome]